MKSCPSVIYSPSHSPYIPHLVCWITVYKNILVEAGFEPIISLQGLLTSQKLKISLFVSSYLILLWNVRMYERQEHKKLWTCFGFQSQHAFEEGQNSDQLLQVQVCLGIGWIVGCLAFGSLVVGRPRGCRITRYFAFSHQRYVHFRLL